jgi:demethylmenaquinone methyltransferase/2-methoxy-6-polyprenyl-1,4-benzoquinol methylase
VAINRDRVQSPNVEYLVTDIFSWRPTTTFDVVFFSFWLSHVPSDRFDEFWTIVQLALKPNGRAFFIDSLLEQTSTARDHAPLDTSGIVKRRLNDGREFKIVKVFYDPPELERHLAERGWRGSVRSTGEFFLFATMIPTSRNPPVDSIAHLGES